MSYEEKATVSLRTYPSSSDHGKSEFQNSIDHKNDRSKESRQHDNDTKVNVESTVRFENFVFSSPYIHFNWSLFWWELFIHVFSPFTALMKPIPHLVTVAPGKRQTLFFSLGLPINLFVMIISGSLSKTVEKTQLVMPLLFYLMHRTMVSECFIGFILPIYSFIFHRHEYITHCLLE